MTGYEEARHQLGELGAMLAPYLKGPALWYNTGEDRLRLRVFNAAAGVRLNLEARTLRVDGSISPTNEPIVPTTDRSEAPVIVNLAEGWLQHVSVRAVSGTPRRGQCWCVVDIVRGQTGALTPVGFIGQGYAKDTSGLAWPGTPMLDSADGPGVIRSILGTDPAVNTEILETVPANARWRLLAVTFSLVADVNVANREVNLTIDDGAAVVARIASGTAQTAGQTRDYTFARNVQRGAPAAGQVINAPLPDAMLMGGYRIQTATTNRQVGDNYGAPQLWVEEWIED